MSIIVKILLGAGILAGVFILYLLIIAILPGLSVPEQPLRDKGTDKKRPLPPPAGRTDVTFDVDGTSVHAWFYLPRDKKPPCPCIIMAGGLGGTKDTGTEPYAVRFQKAGFAVLLFDYRHFGDSDGRPRQLIWIPYQLQDYAAAILFAKDHPAVDAEKIALWGTSLSGGHVIVAAARDHSIACVSAQCPGLDGLASARKTFEQDGFNFKMIMHGQRDLVRSWLGLPAHSVPIVGKPGTVALMTAGNAWEEFRRMVPAGFINRACARIIIRGDKYRPVKYASKVTCPVLLQICDNDKLLPPEPAVETARILGDKATVKHYPIGHFDIYSGENFLNSVKDQVAFFKSVLMSGAR